MTSTKRSKMQRDTQLRYEKPSMVLYKDGTPTSPVFTPDVNGNFTPNSRLTGVRVEKKRDYVRETHAGAVQNGAGNEARPSLHLRRVHLSTGVPNEDIGG